MLARSACAPTDAGSALSPSDKERQMITTQPHPQPPTTNDDPELDIADWIDEECGKSAYSVGSKRSMTLK
jgi:hypothetical protein